MSVDELYSFLYSWCYRVLVTDNSLDIRIIKGDSNRPRPSLPYINIRKPPISNLKQGAGNWDSRTDLEGKLEYTVTYLASIRIEEIGGSGDSLALLLNSLYMQDILDLFSCNNVSLIDSEGIVDVSAITGDYREKRNSVDIKVLYTNATVDQEGITKKNYEAGFIETVEIEGEYIK